jgi:hypothetical protein
MRRKKIDWPFARVSVISVSEPISNDLLQTDQNDGNEPTAISLLSAKNAGKPAKKKGCKICKSMSHIKRVF